MLRAVLFDLDGTLLNRDTAIQRMFALLWQHCYKGRGDYASIKQRFLELDNRGYSNKQEVLQTLFLHYPPAAPLPVQQLYPFWRSHFPTCFVLEPDVAHTLDALHSRYRLAILSNGDETGQMVKIHTTGLEKWFPTIVISGAVGVKKPDTRIFALALDRLRVSASEAVFVGDMPQMDIAGAQGAGMRGIWINTRNETIAGEIKPDAEIKAIPELLPLLERF